MEEKVILLSDQPISAEVDDKFQRYQFSKRIAETIVNRTGSESFAVGIYGAWGEGKTSILNFIRQELEPFKKEIVVFSFNPWRFTDEAALLTTFFNTLASEVENSIPNKDQKKHSYLPFPRLREKLSDWWNEKRSPLKTNTETIGEIIGKYGKIVSILGAGESAVAIGKAISNVDIELLKKRFESLLKQHKKRIVIFIDDIDRLDRNEIHAIFRLVKLTGDFAYTTYVLSFDENMVSAAIGERFGSGDTKAGLNFLEKIIQIPIKIPLAQKAALKNYCFNLVYQALNSNNISLSIEEAGRFVNKFTTYILNRLNTPRLAIRYSNTLSFPLPLLKDEVNTVDLMLIESIRVFYPEIYDAVRTQPDYFIGSYKDQILHSTDTKKVEAYKQLIENLCSNYSEEEKANVKSILNDLFPNQQTVWGGNWIVGGEEQSYKEKKISSTHYFNRYFSYTGHQR